MKKRLRMPKDELQAIPGIGSGTYIAKAYLAMFGGKIWFTSSDAKGTTFFVELPAAK